MYEARQNKEKVSRTFFPERYKKRLFQLKCDKLSISKRNHVVQRINQIPAEEASNSVIEEMNEEKMKTWLLAGRGSVWIKGCKDNPTNDQRDALAVEADKAAGDDAPTCHSCGKEYGKTMVVDHQPPKELASGGYTGTFRFYPQCQDCSNAQGGVVFSYKERMKTVRQADDNDWATGISGDLFWR